MKTFLFSFSLILFSSTSFGQWAWGIDFDNPLYLDRVYNDTIANPNCIWQIGHPAKTVFNTSHTITNAIVTDSLHPVPANDMSAFYLIHQRDTTAPFHVFSLQFWFEMDGDTTDFGTIEISSDNGLSWINLLTQDSICQFYWQIPKPALRGSTTGWQQFYVDMTNWATGGVGLFPVATSADTILFRFTYYTDSSTTIHDGWMIDDFQLNDWWEGVQKIQNNNLISIFPNPAVENLKIQKTKNMDKQFVQIFNSTGQLLLEDKNFIGDNINIKEFENGFYLLKFSDTINYSVKQFVVQH